MGLYSSFLIDEEVLDGGEPMKNFTIASSSVLIVIPGIVVGLRLYARISSEKTLRAEDVLILFALLIAMGMTAAIIYAAIVGNPLGFEKRSSEAVKALVAQLSLYATAIWTIKLSVITFCQRVFGPESGRGRKFMLALLVAGVTMQFVTSFGTTIFACDPVSSQWDPNPAKRHRCLPEHALQTLRATLSALLDAVVLLTPFILLQFSDLETRLIKGPLKAIFALGTGAVLAGFVRIGAVSLRTKHMKNPRLWVLLPLFTSLEISLAITAASLPALQPLFPQFALDRTQTQNVELGMPSNKGRSGGPSTKYTEDVSDRHIPSPTAARRMDDPNARRSQDSLIFMDIIRQGPINEERRILTHGYGHPKAGQVLGV